MDYNFFQQVVVPLFQVSNTCGILLTSPSPLAREVANLTRKSDGRSLLDVHWIQTVCDECREDKFEGNICPHMEMETPGWINNKAKEDMMGFYGEANRQLFEQEMLGETKVDWTPVIAPDIVDAVLDKAFLPLTGNADRIFISVDTSSGGGAYMAVLSCMYDSGNVIVLRIDAQKVKTAQDQISLLTSHICALLSKEKTKRATMVLIIESNYGTDASYLAMNAMKMQSEFRNRRTYGGNIGPCCALDMSSSGGKSGYFKDNNSTSRQKHMLLQYFTEGRVRFCDEFLENPRHATIGRPGACVVDGKNAVTVLLEQAKRYRAELTKTGKVRYHAKSQSDGRSTNSVIDQDDVLISFAMNLDAFNMHTFHNIGRIVSSYANF